MNATDAAKGKVESLVAGAIKNLFALDNRFFMNDAEERTMVGRTAIRLLEKREMIADISREMGAGELSVDYAKRGADIIVHERGTANDVLILRIRKNASEEMKEGDVRDVESLVRERFLFGVIVNLVVCGNDIGYETPFGISK